MQPYLAAPRERLMYGAIDDRERKRVSIMPQTKYFCIMQQNNIVCLHPPNNSNYLENYSLINYFKTFNYEKLQEA